jgi:hypothetical protein
MAVLTIGLTLFGLAFVWPRARRWEPRSEPCETAEIGRAVYRGPPWAPLSHFVFLDLALWDLRAHARLLGREHFPIHHLLRATGLHVNRVGHRA